MSYRGTESKYAFESPQNPLGFVILTAFIFLFLKTLGDSSIKWVSVNLKLHSHGLLLFSTCCSETDVFLLSSQVSAANKKAV